ncbi:MAG TPA: TolC family protein [Phycisphaerae bacterium]|nr:TolC family protein [Phycisphaerae bacterium]
MSQRLLTFVVWPALALAGGCGGGGGSDPALRAGEWSQFVARGDLTEGPAEQAALPPNPTLRDCLTHAALNNAELRAAFHRWQAAVERIAQARALPDPKLTYGYYFLEVETRVGPQRQSFSLSQTFPWFGKLELRGDEAAELAKAKWHAFQAEKLKLYAEVKKAYCEYYYLGRAVSITRDNLKLLEQLERLVRTRYAAGAATHPDLIRLQVELGKLTDRLQSLEQMRRPATARLNAVMGRPDSADELPWPTSLAEEALAASRSQLAEWLRQHNPALRAMDAEAAAADKRVELAKKDYWPDVTLAGTFIDTRNRVGAGRPADSGQDAVVGMVTVNLPIWWNKLAAAVREARHSRWAAALRRVQAARNLAAELDRALYEFEDAGRRAELYSRTLLPKGRESLKVTQTGFAAGTSGFNDLIDAQRVLLEFELSYQRALADRAIWRAEIERLVGRPLTEQRQPATSPSRDADGR